MAVRLALALQQRGQRAVVINADSAQVYSDLRVLSARPTEDEMRGIEHRLFGTWDGAQACSAADWAAAAKEVIADARSSGTVPILVGGTGLYVQALVDGYVLDDKKPDIKKRKELDNKTVKELYNILFKISQNFAKKLNQSDKNNKRRLIRYIEMLESGGKKIFI